MLFLIMCSPARLPARSFEGNLVLHVRLRAEDVIASGR